MLRAQTSWSIILITSLAILVTYRLYFKEVNELLAPTIETTSNAKVIVAFGDSLTEGLFDWPNSRSFHPYTIKLQRLINNEIKKSDSKLAIIVRNFGISGELLRESMEQRLGRVVHTTHPNLLIILGGTNDLLDMEKANDIDSIKRTNEIIQGIKNLHLHCHYKGIPTVALSIPETAIDDRDKNATVATMRRKINNELRDFASSSQVKATFVDISTKISRKHNKKYWDDGVHFTPIGYDRVGEIIYAEIKDMIRSWIKKGS